MLPAGRADPSAEAADRTKNSRPSRLLIGWGTVLRFFSIGVDETGMFPTGKRAETFGE